MQERKRAICVTHLTVVGLLIILSSALPSGGQAHPSISVVADSRGQIFYSDLTHVWKIAPDGTKQIAVPNVHTHELWLSPDDVLYGEDVTNIGQTYRHRVWALHPNGRLRDVVPWREGHPDRYADYSFARDTQNRSYVLRRAEKQIDVRTQEGVERRISLAAHPGHIHWLTVDDKGVIHVAVGARLIRIEAGSDEAKTVADELVEQSEKFDFLQDRHAIMGLWSGDRDDVYVAVFAGQVVKRVAASGEVSVVARNEDEWSMTGGTIDNEGALWLLEFSTSNKVRVRRLGKDGIEEIY